jgi:hypothetical protein
LPNLEIAGRLVSSEAVRNVLRSCGLDRAFDITDSKSATWPWRSRA